MRAFRLPDEELHADAARFQFLGSHGEFNAVAESLVLVDNERGGSAAGSDLPSELHSGF